VSRGDSVLKAQPRELPRTLVAVCVILVLVGIGCFVAGLLTDAPTAWRAFHVNWLFTTGLSLGALTLASALVIVGARWAGPIRHVAEALAAWVPIAFLLAIVGIGGADAVFTNWIHGPPPGKEGWLNPTRVYATDLAILAVLAVLAITFLRTSFRPALGGLAESAPRARGLFARWTAGWRGDELERAESERRLRVLAPINCLAYAFLFAVVVFDQVMSLSPTWFSTIFGWYVCWGGFLTAVAATALASVLLRATTPGWEAQVTRSRMHDLGKMIFAFSIFWMYLFFAQYNVIWYGNLPEETQFFELRLGSQFLQDTWDFQWRRFDEPYVKLSMAAWIGCWWIPFWVLLGQVPKKTPLILGSVAALVMLGFWLERNALVWPSLIPADDGAWIGPIQLGVAGGFLGAYLLVFLVFSRIFPTLPLPSSGTRGEH
jgi:hypothetical protein